MNQSPNIVLASSSPYRKELLSKLLDEFNCASPEIDETEIPGESVAELSQRLARQKAEALQTRFPDSIIIGSDQVASLDKTILRKPMTPEKNFEQLKLCQGKTAFFHTSVCVLNTLTGSYQTETEITKVKFRYLSDEQIENYIQRENALNCAGGFKMEGLGIALFERIQGDDPNALIGLPLIQLIRMLELEGVNVLA